MKKVRNLLLGLSVIVGINGFAQTQDPDQNPNHNISAGKYDIKSDVLSENQGETIQATYEAYDWTENKEARRQNRIDFRRELKMERAKSMRYYYPNSYNNNRYYNNNPYYSNGGSCNTILLGAGLYYLLH